MIFHWTNKLKKINLAAWDFTILVLRGIQENLLFRNVYKHPVDGALNILILSPSEDKYHLSNAVLWVWYKPHLMVSIQWGRSKQCGVTLQCWLVGWLSGFYGKSNFEGYLMPNPFYTNNQFYFKQFSFV